MYSLEIHEDAENDLEDLKKSHPDVAVNILVHLQEIKNDQELLDSLTVYNFGADRTAKYHVVKWWSFWKQGIDLWRLKIWELEDIGSQYRIVYAYMRGQREYAVLGIAHRDWDYDEDHEFTKRVIDAYNDY